VTNRHAATFGDYARHYAVIADFNARLDQAVSKPLQRAFEAGAPPRCSVVSCGWSWCEPNVS
jgi:hypothetical protein